MSRIYAKSTGSNTAPYDTWAKAATSPSTALAAVPNGSGGHEVVLSPERWDLGSLGYLGNPPYAGTAGSRNTLVMDCQAAYLDGGNNSHGLGETKGSCFCSTAQAPLSWSSAAADYWDVKGIPFIISGGTICVFLNTFTANSIRFYDCEAWNLYKGGAYSAGWYAYNMTPASARAVEWYRCMAFGSAPFVAATVKSTAFSATPDFGFYQCFAIPGLGKSGSARAGFQADGPDNSNYTYIDLVNCDSLGTLVMGTNATYSKADSTRSGAASSVWYETSVTTGGSAVTPVTELSALWTPVPLRHKGATINDSLSDYSSGLSGEGQYDLLGQLLAQTPGCIEAVTAQLARAPLSNGGRGLTQVPTSSSGGGLPILGGSVVR